MKSSFYIEAAPMAGYTDLAFRRVLTHCGAKITYTEMVSVTALVNGSKKTHKLLRNDGDTIVQVFGKTPSHFESVIRSGILDNFSEININMGCPAPKIVKNHEGCALMKNPQLAKEIIQICVQSSNKPVSVKMRLGYDDPSGAVQFAKMCESAGAARLIVHGRIGTQGYSGKADWEAIAKVVAAVKIPVIANGDINDASSARKCLEVTKASGVMLGRALLGSPWRIALYASQPDESEIKNIIRLHIEEAKNGASSFPEMKKHLLFYCNKLAAVSNIFSKEMKQQVALTKNFDEAARIMGL